MTDLAEAHRLLLIVNLCTKKEVIFQLDSLPRGGIMLTIRTPVTMTVRLVPSAPVGWASRVSTLCCTFWKGRDCTGIEIGKTVQRDQRRMETDLQLFNNGVGSLHLTAFEGEHRLRPL
jgi:hypothetical protein